MADSKAQSVARSDEKCGRVYGGYDASFLGTHPETLLDAISNYAMGSCRNMQLVLPIMKQNGYGRLANVASGIAAFWVWA
ncbi:MAG: hypothetical protein AAF636_23910 [Pseudomonadota bacterium]